MSIRLRPFLCLFITLAPVLPVAATPGGEVKSAEVRADAGATPRVVRERPGAWCTLTRPVAQVRLGGVPMDLEEVDLLQGRVRNWRWQVPANLESGQYELVYEYQTGDVFPYILEVEG